MGVLVEVDARLFPMEIAKRMLELGVPLAMEKGPTAYFEAERSLIVLLDSLSVYHKVIWPALESDYRKHQRSVEKFLSLHWMHQGLKDSLARQLLDFMSYFPVANFSVAEPKELPYREVLDNDDLT